MPAASISLDEAVDLARTGDVWLFRGRAMADRAIQVATNSPVNHVGMSVVIEDLPPLMWHAELGRSLPDAWTGARHRGVQLHDLRDAVGAWAGRYGQRAWLRQLDPVASGEMEDAVLRTVARLDGTPFPSTAQLASRWLLGPRAPRLLYQGGSRPTGKASWQQGWRARRPAGALTRFGGDNGVGPEGFPDAGGLAGAVFGPGDPARHVPGVGVADVLGFKVITQFEQGIVFRWGRALPGVRGAGLTWVNPFTDRLRKVNMQVVVAAVPAQEAITRDNVTLTVDAVVYYRVVDPAKAIINVQDYPYAVSQVAQTSLRSVIGQSDMDQLLSERDKVNAHLKDVIDAPTEQPWGIRVERVEVKDVSLPESMKRSMSRQAEAERERRARVISADGEYQAARKLAQAAAVMAADPAALQLRLLQTVVEVAAEKNSTLVMPVPVELLRFFDRAARATGQAWPAAAATEDAPAGALEVPVPEVPALAAPPGQAVSPAHNAPLGATLKAPATA